MQLSSHPISYTDNSAWLKVSREAKSMVKKMLTRDPRIRPSAEELLAHEFFQDKLLTKQATKEELLEINNNLLQFRKSTFF